MKKKRSILLLISALLGIAYGVYIVSYFIGSNTATNDTAEAIGVGIATALVMPHMVCAVLAAIMNSWGWALSRRGFSLTGGILYAVAAALFPMYAMFVLVQMVLSFVGLEILKTLNAAYGSASV